jgi:flagellar biogenesis protein FliO
MIDGDLRRTRDSTQNDSASRDRGSGLAAWLLARLHRAHRPALRLELLERIALGPRQTLALVEAEGRRFLVATAQDGSPAFHALDANNSSRLARQAHASGRVSW